MAMTEAPIRPSHSLNNLHRDMRAADPHPPATPLDLPEHDSATSISPLDGHLVAHPLHLDLYNPMSSSSKQKLQQVDSNVFSTSSNANRDKSSAQIYYHHRHQRKSSTASLAEFLKTTGPDELRQESPAGMARPVSPTNNRKKTPGTFLLKFAVGKSTGTTRRDETDEMPIGSKGADNSTPPIAEQQFTAAGRKYYAIKVDYPYDDDGSISARPLLADSTADSRIETRSEVDYQAIMAMKKHHRLSSVLASDTSMEFLVEGDGTPRSSARYSGNTTTNSLARSSSLSEIVTNAESFPDDSSLLPADSISLRPAQVSRTRIDARPVYVESTSIPLRHAARHGLSVGGVRSPSPSDHTRILQGGSVNSSRGPSPTPAASVVTNETMELMESLEMLDKIRKQRSLDTDSMVSYTTTRSLQQRRRAKKAAQHSGSVDETRRTSSKRSIKTSKSTADLNEKGLPLLPPHMISSADESRRVRAAAVAAALAPRIKRAAQQADVQQAMMTSKTRSYSPPLNRGSLEKYSIPEDDVMSLRSGISEYRSQRKEKVRDKRQKDFDEERSRKLDEAMRLLQKDVLRKKEALDRDAPRETNSIGSQTPRQMPSVERLRTPPVTPPQVFAAYQLGFSSVTVLLDCSPSGMRHQHSPVDAPQSHIPGESRPKTSNSQHTVFTNRPITPVSSPPSSPTKSTSPTKSQYSHLARQPIPQLTSSPPNYPPPQPSPLQSSRSSKLSKLTEEDDPKKVIAALEEQTWVLEQALRVLLNQQSGAASPGLSPILGYFDRSSRSSPDQY